MQWCMFEEGMKALMSGLLKCVQEGIITLALPYFEKVLDQINILHGEKNDFILVLIKMDNISPIQRMKTR